MRLRQRLGQRLAGLGAALLLLGIIAGLPVALLAAGHLPHAVPSIEQLLRRDDGTLALTLITVIGWAAWAYLTVAITLEIIARLRGVRAPHLTGFHLPQAAARGLVSTAMLLFVAIPAGAPAAHATTIPRAPTIASTSAMAVPASVTASPLVTDQATITPDTDQQTEADAGAHPAKDTRPPTGAHMAHTVRRGESLWSIAERYLGDGRRFPEIATLNRDVIGGDPGFLEAGTVLSIPTRPTAPRLASPATTPASGTVTVKKGDTLSGIAEEELGDANRYPEIFTASRGITQPGGAHLSDPDLIYPGWTVKLPQPARGGGAVPMAEHRTATPTHAGEQAPSKEKTPSSGAPTPAVGSPGSAVKAATPTQDTAREPAPSPIAADPKTAPTATATTAPNRASAPAMTAANTNKSDASDTSDTALSAPWLLTGLVGGGGVLAGSMMMMLRRRRQAQFRARRPGRTIATPSPQLAPVEKTLAVIGSTSIPAVEHLDQILRRLSAARAEHHLAMPEVAAVQLTRATLTLHLSAPAALTQPWNGSADQLRWSVTTGPDATEQIGPLVADRPAPYPLLVTIGEGPDGDVWLLNVEDLTLNITGDLDYGRDFARYLVAEIACNPWSHGIRADLVGVGAELASMNPDRVRVHKQGNGDAAAEVLADAVAMIDQAQDAGLNVTTARATRAGADPWPARMIIVDAATETTPALSRLLDLVNTHAGFTGTSVVVRGEHQNDAGTVLHLSSSGRVTLPASGLDLVAVGLTSDEAQGCAALLTQSDDLADIEIPAEQDAQGWRAWTNQAGALRTEHTLPRHDPAAEQTQDPATSMLEARDEEYVRQGATTPQDLAVLAPKVPAEVSAAVLDADPGLDQDLAAWWASDCPLPRLSLLGPVGARTRGTPLTRRKPYYTEVLAFLSTRAHGATPEELADAFGISPDKARDCAATVRTWLGTNPRTGQKHLPPARKTPAAKSRGVGVYQVLDILIDLDLFRRLRARGEARGPDGIDDLDAALRLVQGRPFDRLRTGGWSWLTEGDRLEHHMVCAIVDVAHLVTTHALHAGDLKRARLAAETAALAAPYEEIPRLDLAAVADAEGHTDQAQRLLNDDVYNRTDDDDAPTELSERTQQIIASKDWATTKNTRHAS